MVVLGKFRPWHRSGLVLTRSCRGLCSSIAEAC
jgi:hypothetical protein